MLIKKYGAEWCAPCRKLEPILDMIERDHANINIERFDVDELNSSEEGHQELLDLRITGIPVLFLFDDEGNEVERINGSTTLHYILESLGVQKD